MYSSLGSSRHEPDSDPINDSDEELFGSSFRQQHNTVATVPLSHAPKGDAASETTSEDNEHETVATIPLHRHDPATQQEDSVFTRKITQPTQLLPRSPPAQRPRNASFSSISPPSSRVQVQASSPAGTPSSGAAQRYNKRPGGYMSAMAPPGTRFQPPSYAPSRINHPVILSDEEGPTYKGGSSDEEIVKAGNMKTTNFQRAGYVPESPANNKSNGVFSRLVQGFEYNSEQRPSSSTKRPIGDVMASSYGNVSKKPKQTAPARAKPVVTERQTSPDMELDDINNANDRAKVRKMMSFVTDASIKTCYRALMMKHGNTDDALDYIMDMQEKKDSQGQRKTIVDLTSSDDELITTPAVQKSKAFVSKAKQEARNAGRTITDKWSSTQRPVKEHKHLNAFSPPKQEKPRKRLVRGRKEPSSPDFPGHRDDESTSVIPHG